MAEDEENGMDFSEDNDSGNSDSVVTSDDTGDLVETDEYGEMPRANTGGPSPDRLFTFRRQIGRLSRLFFHHREILQFVDDSSIPDLNADEARDITFDRSLPERHDYLNPTEMDLTSGRAAFLANVGEEIILPFITQTNFVLLPRQSVPMYFNRQRDIALLQRVVDGDCCFLIIPVLSHLDSSTLVGKFATLAQIMLSGADDLDNFKVIAEGRERCQILNVTPSTSFNDARSAKVLLEHNGCLGYKALSSLSHNFVPSRSDKNQLRHLSSITGIPPWILYKYDVYNIMHEIRSRLSRLFINESGIARLTEEPTGFSFLVAGFLPISDKIKYKLLSCTSALHRLLIEVEFLRHCEVLQCAACSNTLARVSEMIVMSDAGALASYVNPGGIIYETLTLHKLCGPVMSVGRPQTENSWFPGYAWTPSSCGRCGQHIGWLFTHANRPELRPPRFWGVAHSALTLPKNLEQRLLQMVSGSLPLDVTSLL